MSDSIRCIKASGANPTCLLALLPPPLASSDAEPVVQKATGNA